MVKYNTKLFLLDIDVIWCVRNPRFLNFLQIKYVLESGFKFLVFKQWINILRPKHVVTIYVKIMKQVGVKYYELDIFISQFNQLDAQNLFHSKFYFMPLRVSSTCARNM